MAHRKAGGSTALGRDSISKRLGVKLFAGQKAKTGNIIVKQRGTKFRPGNNTKRTNDDSIMAMVDGVVAFEKRKFKRFTGKAKQSTMVHVEAIAKK